AAGSRARWARRVPAAAPPPPPPSAAVRGRGPVGARPAGLPGRPAQTGREPEWAPAGARKPSKRPPEAGRSAALAAPADAAAAPPPAKPAPPAATGPALTPPR